MVLTFNVPFTRPIACHTTVYLCLNMTRLITNLCKCTNRDGAALIYSFGVTLYDVYLEHTLLSLTIFDNVE